ncbi:MAG: TonB-dependent receptor [Gemmatimonadota bacterium]
MNRISFEFRRTPLNPYIVAFSVLGFLSLSARGPQTAAAQEIDLRLDTLQVEVGTRLVRELPYRTRAVEVIDRDAIQGLPVRNVHELLRWITGAELQDRSPAQADVSIRGSGFQQVLVLVDGVRMTDPQTGHFSLNLPVPLDQVERVEVLRGAASTVYGGDAMAGVIHVVTRSGGDRWQARLEGGSFGSGRVAITGDVDGRVRVSGGAEFSRSDGHRPGVDHESVLAQLRLRTPWLGGDAFVDGAFGQRAFGASDFYAPFPSFEETGVLTLSTGWRPAPVPTGWAVEPRLVLRRHTDDFLLIRDQPEGYRNVHTSWQAGGETAVRYRSPRGWGVVMGGEIFRESLESTNLGDRTEDRSALYVEAVAEPTAGSVVTVGVRRDVHESFGAFVSPGLSLAWSLSPGFRVRGGVTRAFRAPSWTERYYTDPNHEARAGLEPERATAGELGTDFLLPRGVRVSGTLFLRLARDLIDWSVPEGTSPGAGNPWASRNVDEANFRGAEAEVVVPEFLGARWSLGATALSLRASSVGGFDSKYALRPLREQVTAGVSRPIMGCLSGAARMLHGRRAGETSFQRVDVRARCAWSSGEVYADVLNLTDAQYRDVVGAPVAGRGFSVGMAVRPTR